MPDPTTDLTRLRFYPATPSRWPHVERLFGERGACGGCWCMVWRLRNKEWTAGKGSKNRRAFKKLVTDGAKPGVLAYQGRDPIGWCAIAPREVYGTLSRSRVLKPVDDAVVWSVSCLFVLKPFRRQGLSVALLSAAVDHAASRGAKIVEGYPIQPTMEKTPDAFVWLGIPSAYRRAGFKEVLRRSRTRPIMRCTIEDR
jgi:GNAT superfamily N-acetyltransferase